MADNKFFDLQVISPDRMFFEGQADMIELRTTEGEIGVFKGHIPMTMILSPGVLRIIKEKEVKEAALHDGFIEILPDKITIMAESCEWPDEIDVKRAEEAKIRAEERLKGKEGEANVARAELALRRSLTRLQLAEKYSK